MNIKNLTTFILFTSMMLSCQKNEQLYSTLYFIGDSQIANWDTEASFPNHITYNIGKDGIGILEIEKLSIPNGSTIILEVGTNDLVKICTEEELNNYINEYIRIIKQIPSKKIFVLEVFPTDNLNRNKTIKLFNEKLCHLLKNNEKIRITHIYDFLSNNNVIKPELSRDGIHLNDYGYIIITNLVKAEL